MTNIIDFRDKSSLLPDLNKYCAIYIDGKEVLVERICENCEYRDLHGLTKPCTDCHMYNEWLPRIDMHLRAYGGLT